MKGTKHCGKKPSMTRKQALAVIYQLREVYIKALSYEVYEETKAFRDQVFDALIVLTEASHGKPEIGQSVVLCAACHLRYAEFYQEGKWCDISPRLCSSCYEQQKSTDNPSQVAQVLL